MAKSEKIIIQPTDEELIGKLSVEHQSALNIKTNYEAAAAELGIKVGTLKSRRFRAYQILKALRSHQPGIAS